MDTAAWSHGGDAFLLAALVHTLASEKRLKPGRLAAFTDGLEPLLEALQAFSPEAVAARTGIDAATIRTRWRATSPKHPRRRPTGAWVPARRSSAPSRRGL